MSAPHSPESYPASLWRCLEDMILEKVMSGGGADGIEAAEGNGKGYGVQVRV